mmetsp:Transcript_4142/g.14290  ORF Transcript_4142/g.14290 Transcript_4142/m.14290 type:complete len:251 (-) Transcript_4142:266-1018(-)
MPVSWHVAPAFLNCGGARVGRGRGARQLLYGHWGAERARVCSRGRPWGAASRRGERRARAKARRAEEGLRRREWRPPLSARRAAEKPPASPRSRRATPLALYGPSPQAHGPGSASPLVLLCSLYSLCWLCSTGCATSSASFRCGERPPPGGRGASSRRPRMPPSRASQSRSRRRRTLRPRRGGRPRRGWRARAAAGARRAAATRLALRRRALRSRACPLASAWRAERTSATERRASAAALSPATLAAWSR